MTLATIWIVFNCGICAGKQSDKYFLALDSCQKHKEKGNQLFNVRNISIIVNIYLYTQQYLFPLINWIICVVKAGKLQEALAAFNAGVVAAEKGPELGICLANR